MLQNLTGWHALIILAIVLLVFGAAKLPALARSVGQSVRILKTETIDGNDHTAGAERAVAVENAAAVPGTSSTVSESRSAGPALVAVDTISR